MRTNGMVRVGIWIGIIFVVGSVYAMKADLWVIAVSVLLLLAAVGTRFSFWCAILGGFTCRAVCWLNRERTGIIFVSFAVNSTSQTVSQDAYPPLSETQPRRT